VAKKFWVMLRCGPLDAGKAELMASSIRRLAPRRPTLFGVIAASMPMQRGNYLVISAVRRGGSGKIACDSLTAEVRRVASQEGLPDLPIASRSAATVERQGWFGWVSGDLVFGDGPGHPPGPAGVREPRVPVVPPDSLRATAEPPPEAQ
jgi:hypothetical protein